MSLRQIPALVSSLPGIAVTSQWFLPLELKSAVFHVSLCCANSLAHSVVGLLSRCQGCEVVLSGIEEQVSRANQHKEQQLALKQQIESEVSGYSREHPVLLALKQLEPVPWFS